MRRGITLQLPRNQRTATNQKASEPNDTRSRIEKTGKLDQPVTPAAERAIYLKNVLLRRMTRKEKAKRSRRKQDRIMSNMSRTQWMKSTFMLPRSNPMPQPKLPGQQTSNLMPQQKDNLRPADRLCARTHHVRPAHP